MIDISKYDKVLEDLKSMLFSERKSRKLNKLEPNFYKNLHLFFIDLNSEKDIALTTDIKEYLEITRLLAEARKNFKAFFQVRFEKIAKYSVYDEIEEYSYNLTGEEKNIMRELNTQMLAYYSDFIAMEQQNEPNINEEVAAEESFPEIKQDKPEVQPAPLNEDTALIRILKDQPVIAQPDRDYCLHGNDIIYVKESFAAILYKHGACVYIKKK
ncbi:MAG: hypothetical protein QXZ44_06270 [Ferroplasma sp.]